MKVIDGAYPWYCIQCDGYLIEVVWSDDYDVWCLLEDEFGDWQPLINVIGASFQDLQDGISEAVADYEHNQQVLENRKLIEVVQ
jgi:hypothetical protein